MNNIDKQYSWDRIYSLLLHRGIVDVTAPPTSALVESEIAGLIATRKAFLAIQSIGDVPPEQPLFTDEQLAQLLVLIRIAVWIRGEQLAHPNAVLAVQLEGTGPNKVFPTGIVAEVDTHNLAITRARQEFEAGQKLFTHLQQYCEQHAIGEWTR